jgi:hypothetical protein
MVSAVLSINLLAPRFPGHPPHELKREVLHENGTENRIPPKVIDCHPAGIVVTSELSTTESGEWVSVRMTCSPNGPLAVMS